MTQERRLAVTRELLATAYRSPSIDGVREVLRDTFALREGNYRASIAYLSSVSNGNRHRRFAARALRLLTLEHRLAPATDWNLDSDAHVRTHNAPLDPACLTLGSRFV